STGNDPSGTVGVRPRYQFVHTATGINNSSSGSIVTVQPLIARAVMVLRAYDPDNHIIGAVRRRDKRRPTSVRSHTPFTDNSWRIGCCNAESRELEFACATGNIRFLVSTVRGRGLHYILIGNMQGSYRSNDAAEVTAIKQIGIAIFAQCNHETGRCRAGNVH